MEVKLPIVCSMLKQIEKLGEKAVVQNSQEMF
jgi:hypothetical protein